MEHIIFLISAFACVILAGINLYQQHHGRTIKGLTEIVLITLLGLNVFFWAFLVFGK